MNHGSGLGAASPAGHLERVDDSARLIFVGPPTIIRTSVGGRQLQAPLVPVTDRRRATEKNTSPVASTSKFQKIKK
ncbi:hypothetical protein NQ156_01280 [Microbacterium sp. zg.Y625]|uniref:hypothetical protein n=1 Tax=Microbacterium jiangjiandongii TaxID=3049071 RepID=UPI00214C8CC1|nr:MULTISPECIES: hypothetical protein [unclassified Microbacterium]MCR2791692.1 hypothetical protein [Microbacterium sp. zg.Y625]WIM24510.1 hypothetical protein QNO14_10190 [Microbacterium sp. zg-Y625]